MAGGFGQMTGGDSLVPLPWQPLLKMGFSGWFVHIAVFFFMFYLWVLCILGFETLARKKDLARIHHTSSHERA